MKRYFVGGKEISEQQANEIRQRNAELIKSEDIKDWWNCTFIFVVDDDSEEL